MTTTPFHLESSGLLTTAEMAAALSPPVTPQMLLRYAKEGLCVPESARGGAGGKSRMWDPVKVRAALRKNKKSASKHGGKRKNATGRRIKRSGDPGLSTEFAAFSTFDEIRSRTAGTPGSVTVLDTLKFGARETEAVCKVAEHVGLTVAHVDLLKSLQSAQMMSLEIEKERGTLIGVDDVKTAFGVALAQVRAKLEEMPSQVTGSAATALRLGPDQQGSLRVIVDSIVRGTLQMLAVEMDQNLRRLTEKREGR